MSLKLLEKWYAMPEQEKRRIHILGWAEEAFIDGDFERLKDLYKQYKELP